jgi:GNAT superfamily N-acetyltransferase
MTKILKLDADEARRNLSVLAAILVDCVEGGASVSFMLPFSLEEAESYFRIVVEGLERGDRILLGGFVDDALVGTVQLLTRMPPNQPHRAEIAKLLVARSHRGQGVASALMTAAEEHARAERKTLLMLDTASGSNAERLYTRLNWTRACVIPGYAKLPDGRWCDTTFFWKALS